MTAAKATRSLWLAVGLILAMLVIPGSLFAAGEAEEEAVTLEIWHQEEPARRVERFQEVFDAFMEEYPEIEVVQEVQTWGEAYSRTTSAIAAGQQPDLLFATPDFAANIKQTGGIYPVDEIIDVLAADYNIYDQALDPYYYEDHHWAVPLFGMNHLLYYRKSVFEEAGLDPESPPETWEELREYIDILKEEGVVDHGIGVPVSRTLAGDQFIHSLLVTNKAVDILGPDQQEVIFNNERTVETYEFWHELYQTSPPGSLAWQWVEPQTALVNKETAFGIIMGGFLGHWEEEAEQPADDLGAGFVPQPADDGQPGTYYASNGVMLLTDDPAKVEAATKLFEFLYRPENKGWFLNAQPGLFLPVTEEAGEADSFWEADNPIMEQYSHIVELMIEQSQYGALYGFTADEINPRIGRIGGEYILAQVGQRIADEGYSVEEAVEWGAQQMQEALE